jgi:hypothetical protein
MKTSSINNSANRPAGLKQVNHPEVQDKKRTAPVQPTGSGGRVSVPGHDGMSGYDGRGAVRGGPFGSAQFPQSSQRSMSGASKSMTSSLRGAPGPHGQTPSGTLPKIHEGPLPPAQRMPASAGPVNPGAPGTVDKGKKPLQPFEGPLPPGGQRMPASAGPAAPGAPGTVAKGTPAGFPPGAAPLKPSPSGATQPAQWMRDPPNQPQAGATIEHAKHASSGATAKDKVQQLSKAFRDTMRRLLDQLTPRAQPA